MMDSDNSSEIPAAADAGDGPEKGSVQSSNPQAPDLQPGEAAGEPQSGPEAVSVANPQPVFEPAPPKRTLRDLLRNPPQVRGVPPKNQGFFFQIGTVLGIAIVIATLFTAWTPGLADQAAYLPPPATLIAQVLRPSPTAPPGAPTATLANPNLVGIVAGHWKNDSGAVCPDGLKEVDINLNIATRVQKLLKEQGYEVDLLKEFDDRLPNYQAAALVSIHNDSCDFINNEATGYKVAAAMGTRQRERAALLTACLRARFGQATGKPVHSTSVTPDMTSYHTFGDINENTPAAIIETGFMNLDRELLTEHPDVVAQGVAAGILCFLRGEPLVTPTPLPAKPTIEALPEITP